MNRILTAVCFLYLLMTCSLWAQTFTLKSKTLSGQATAKLFFDGFGCTGENISPQLYWEHAPEGTKSFAITIYDPDAPTGSGFWHWQVFDIPADVTEIEEGASGGSGQLPAGVVETRNDYGNMGFGGPCPPAEDGPHQYLITVYALDTDKLGPDASASAAVVGFMLNAHVIEKSSLVCYGDR